MISDCFIRNDDNIVEKQNTVQLSSLAELKKKIDARANKQDEQRPGTSTLRLAPKRKAGSAQNDHNDQDDPPPKQTKLSFLLVPCPVRMFIGEQLA